MTTSPSEVLRVYRVRMRWSEWCAMIVGMAFLIGLPIVVVVWDIVVEGGMGLGLDEADFPGALAYMLVTGYCCCDVARSILEIRRAAVFVSDARLVHRNWRGRESTCDWAELDGLRVTEWPSWVDQPAAVALLTRGTVLRLPRRLDGPEELVEEAIARAGLSMVTRAGLSTRYERPELATDAPRGW